METRAAIATPETDAELRMQYCEMGKIARRSGQNRSDCPVNGLIGNWWREGWDTAWDRDTSADVANNGTGG